MKYILSFLFFAFASSASAYFTTEQHAFTANQRTGIFTVAYEFGHESHEIRIPIIAMRGGAPREDAVRFEVMDGDLRESNGTAVGIVLSHARVEDGMYVIPKGKKASFTLLVFYTITADAPEDMYRVEVTHLPFTFDGAQKLKLNPSELQYYTTPLLTLGAKAVVLVK